MHICVGYQSESIPVKILPQKFHGLRAQRKLLKKNYFLKIIELRQIIKSAAVHFVKITLTLIFLFSQLLWKVDLKQEKMKLKLLQKKILNTKCFQDVQEVEGQEGIREKKSGRDKDT